MKKNCTMKIAIVLAVLTLFTTCFVSGTFAKYVTSGTANDTARVAKFGVTVEGSSDLFKVKYETHDDVFEEKFSVLSSSDDKLVAPGTSGSFAKFALTGRPEVAVRVSYEVTEIELENWIYTAPDEDETDDVLPESEFYCPLIIGIGEDDETTTDVDETNYINGLNYASADEFAAAIKAAVAAVSTDYPAKTNLSRVADEGIAISWHWNFEGTTGSANNQTDVKDTYLGDQAAADNAATIELAVTCTVTQID